MNKKTETTYNHAFDIGFAVSGSKYEDSFECLENEPKKVIAALLNRIASLMTEEEDCFVEAIGSAFDTYEEEDFNN